MAFLVIKALVLSCTICYYLGMNGGKRVVIKQESNPRRYDEVTNFYAMKKRPQHFEPVDETWVPNPRAIAGSLESTPPAYREMFKDFEERMAKRGIKVRG